MKLRTQKPTGRFQWQLTRGSHSSARAPIHVHVHANWEPHSGQARAVKANVLVARVAVELPAALADRAG